MTDKMEQFCQEYLVDLNATQAALRSGYSKDTAGSIGHENLKKDEIRVRIGELMDNRSKKLFIDAEFVIENLKEVANRSLQAIPVMEFDFEDKCMKQMVSESGNPIWEFDSNGANRALELLGKHLGMFKNEVELKNTVNIAPEQVAAIADKINANAK